jgi:hypothetical protein
MNLVMQKAAREVRRVLCKGRLPDSLTTFSTAPAILFYEIQPLYI